MSTSFAPARHATPVSRELDALPMLRLRGLDLLRSFVAVGRRMSITQAADDLCLSQPAVSRRIRLLEDRLGMRLFVRGHRAIRFTSDGERLFAAADLHLTGLQRALGGLIAPVVSPLMSPRSAQR